MSYNRYYYTKINWVNKSEGLTTPLGKTNLNHMDYGIYNIAENLDVVYSELSLKKFDEKFAGKVIKEMPTWDSETGILHFAFYDGTEFNVDFNVEKIPISFSMDSAGVITMVTSDGTEWTANIGDVIPNYTFTSSDRVIFTKTKDDDDGYIITADIAKGSISGEYLEPNYLLNITTQASKAEASENNAFQSAENASYDAKLAQSYSIGGSGVRDGEDEDNAKHYSKLAAENQEKALTSETSAANSANKAESYAIGGTKTRTGEDTDNAKYYSQQAFESASSAATSASAASTKATNAASSAASASSSASSASTSMSSASSSATAAANSASAAATSATQANNYANGSTNSAKYYYEQAKSISESFSGALRPMGTVTFSNLPAVSSATEGDMYNISDEFVTTSDFIEGEGITEPSGSNVYKTVGGKWDVLSGTPVTGVKGSAETSFRKGNVNITPEDIGIKNATASSAGLTKVDTALSSTSENPVQNKVVNSAFESVDSDIESLETRIEHIAEMGIGVALSIGSDSEKTVSYPGFKLKTGATIAVFFRYTNTHSIPKMNVNSTGAIAIKTIMGYDVDEGKIYNTPVNITSGLHMFVYDGTYWCLCEKTHSFTIASGSSVDIGYGTSLVLPRAYRICTFGTGVSGNNPNTTVFGMGFTSVSAGGGAHSISEVLSSSQITYTKSTSGYGLNIANNTSVTITVTVNEI